jgi:hypothetical protein
MPSERAETVAMNAVFPRAVPGVARLYGVIAYAASLALILLAAMLTATRARDAFIFIFLPGVLLAVLTPFIWSGSRSAMLLALAVSVVLQIMVVGGGNLDWRLFLPMPAAFTALTIAAFASANRSVEPAAGGGVLAEVFATAVYFSGVLAVFMAPFNYSRLLGWPGLVLYAAMVGLAAAALGALIWRGSIWAMVATFALSLLHLVVLGQLDPALWRNVPNIAAAAASGMLAMAGVAAAIARRAAPASGAGRRPAGAETRGDLRRSASRPGEHAGKEQATE